MHKTLKVRVKDKHAALLQGEPLQDDADDALAWIASRAAATAPAGGVWEQFQSLASSKGWDTTKRADGRWNDMTIFGAWMGYQAALQAARVAAELTDERAAFEAHMRDTGWHPSRLHWVDGAGRYSIETSQVAWEAWQARAALATQQAAQGAEPVGGAERWMAIVREKADDARKNAHGLRQFEGMEAEARARELAAQYLLETAHVMVLDERHAEALANIVDQSERLARLRAAITAPPPTAKVEKDAALWRYVRHHWSNAQMRWNNDATNSLKSITLTIKTAHWTSGADDIEQQLLAALQSDQAQAGKGDGHDQ